MILRVICQVSYLYEKDVAKIYVCTMTSKVDTILCLKRGLDLNHVT